MIRGIIFPTQDGMGSGCDAVGDFRQMSVHGRGVDEGKDQRRCEPARGADGPEDIGPLIAGIAGCPGSGAASGPDTGEGSLLPDPCFILEPDFEGSAPRGLRDRNLYRLAEVFLNGSCATGSVLGCCGRTESLR